MSKSEVTAAVLDALDASKHPVRAEQVFYLLKATANKDATGSLVSINPVSFLQEHFDRPVIYSSLKKLEDLGFIKKNSDGAIGKHIKSILLLKEDVKLVPEKRGRKPGTQKKMLAVEPAPQQAKGSVVFLDENEFIRAKQSGIEFNLGEILDRMSGKLGGNLLRVFIYISEKTEHRNFREARGLYASGRSEVRYIKTESLPGEVDRKMRDDIVLWSQTTATDRIVIGTADGGSEFQSAIQSAKANGKEVVLLEAAGVFNRTLSDATHGRINVTAENPRSDEFRGLVTEVRLNRKVDRRNLNARFICAVAVEMRYFFRQETEARFMKIVNWIWEKLQTEWLLKGYSPDDVRSAISALQHQGYVLRWQDRLDKETHRPVKVYWLHEGSEVLNVLTQK